MLNSYRNLASHSLPETAARLSRLIAECGLREPQLIDAWIGALSLLKGVSESLEVFDPAIFGAPLDEFATALAPASRGTVGRILASVSGGDYRKASKEARRYWRIGKPKPRVLGAAVTAAAAQVREWRKVSADGQLPHLPSDLIVTAGVFGQFYSELQALAVLAGGTGFTRLSIRGLYDCLKAMLDDTETLYKLPELARCRTMLRQAGLSPLLEEMSSHGLSVDYALACADHVWMSSILETVAVADPYVGAFDGQAHTRHVREFCTADDRHIASTSIRVQRQHHGLKG